MLKIKEDDSGWYLEEKLYMPDPWGKRGIDLFDNAEIHWVRKNEPADIAICKNGDRVKDVPIEKSMALIFEPPSQAPFLYDQNFYKRYGLGSWSIVKGYPDLGHFYIPRGFNHVTEFFHRPKDKLLAFAGNEMRPNGHPSTDLLARRKEALRFFAEQLGPERFIVMGHSGGGRCYVRDSGFRDHGLNGYNLSCPATINKGKGWDSKYAFFSRADFTLALENSTWPGYYGCKAIEAMQCGSIPLYIGDTDIDSHTPKDVYIDMRGRTNADLLNLMTTMEPQVKEDYRKRIWDYIYGPGGKLFSSYEFAKRLIPVLTK